MRRPLAIVAVTFITCGWVGALIAAPSAAALSQPAIRRASAGVYLAGSLICHQRPERSFHLDGAKLPVCARCFGLYAGSVLGVVAWAVVAGLRLRPTSRARRFAAARNFTRALIIVTLPTLVSLLIAWIGWWQLPNVQRAVVALPLGAVVGAIVCAVAAGDLR